MVSGWRVRLAWQWATTPRVLLWTSLALFWVGIAACMSMAALVVTLMDNAALSHGAASTVFGAAGVAVALFSLSVAPALDRATHPAYGVVSLLGASVVRLALAAILWTLPSPVGFWNQATLCGLVIFSLGVDVVGLQILGLTLNRIIDHTTRAEVGKRREAYRSRVFSVAYAIGNASAFLAALAYDQLRLYVPSVARANAAAYTLAAIAAALGTLPLVASWRDLCDLAAWTVRQGKDGGGGSNPDGHHHPTGFQWTPALLWDRSLWRFAGVCLWLVGTRAIFRHLDATLPVVMIRSMGPRARFALIQGINALLLIPLAPTVQHFTARFAHYPVLLAGTCISTVSLVPLAIPWTGHSLWPYVVFVVIFSMGEALWSARFVAYAMDEAPPNQQPTYQALAGLPTLATKPLVAWASAALVQGFCAESGSCHAEWVWTGVALMSAATPLGLLIFRRCLDSRRSVLNV